MRKPSYLSLLLALAAVLAACSVTRHVPDGEVVVNRVNIMVDGRKTDDARLLQSVKERPYHRTFGFLPLAAWMWHDDDSTAWHRLRQRLGTKPTVMTPEGTERACRQMLRSLHQSGYTDATVQPLFDYHGRKVDVLYSIDRGLPRTVRNIRWEVEDDSLQSLIGQQASLLTEGQILDRQKLEQERTRLLNLMRDHGYWGFNKEDVRFIADTLPGERDVDLSVIVRGRHPLYSIGQLRYLLPDGQPQDFMRQAVLDENCFLEPGERYDEQNLRRTYSSMSRLHYLKYTQIRLEQYTDSALAIQLGLPADANLLRATVSLMPQTPNSLQFELDGTNTSGDKGFAAALTYTQRNLFHGSETYTASLRGGYESLSGNLSGLVNDNYSEYAFDNRIELPKFVFPFLSREQRRHFTATSSFRLGYHYQTRPEYTRIITQGAFSYKWVTHYATQQIRHSWDVVDLSYVSLPKRSDAFLQIIQNAGPISYSSYSNHLIMAMAYNAYFGNAGVSGMTHSRPNTSQDIWSLRLSPEIAGNVLQGFATANHVRRRNDRYEVFDLPFEQYARFDADWSYSRFLTDRSRLALHLAGGVAVPYGNSKVMPFEKRYYAGGANSVRGWSVRSLGPGRYHTANGESLDYFNKCGDVRLDASVEWRSKIFWKLEGAAFIDAGNVWTLRDYESQPNGAISGDFYKEIAASWGLGLRMVTDFVILRLDLGIKAYDPTVAIGRDCWVIDQPNRSHNRTLHFAVGYPF